MAVARPTRQPARTSSAVFVRSTGPRAACRSADPAGVADGAGITVGQDHLTVSGVTMGEGSVVRATPGSFWTAGIGAGARFELMVEEVGYLYGPPLHTHEVQEDSFYVLDGVLTVQIGDEVVELQKGDFAVAPAGVAHTFTNTDPDRTARMLNVMAPSIGFERLVAASRSGADRAELERLVKEYGITFVGPTLPKKLGLR